MNTSDNIAHLDGKILIAMPLMADPRFERSLIYMCAHSDQGAMGLVINKPAPDLEFTDLLKQLNIEIAADVSKIHVHFGGPVEHGRGFVLHSAEYESQDATLHVNDQFGMTATLDVLKDISTGKGPSDCLLALGYAGWGPGQLEEELKSNGWLTCDANADLVFAEADQSKWTAAVKSLGISPSFLSSEGGRA